MIHTLEQRVIPIRKSQKVDIMSEITGLRDKYTRDPEREKTEGNLTRKASSFYNKLMELKRQR